MDIATTPTHHFSLHITTDADEAEVTEIVRQAVESAVEDLPDDPGQWDVALFREPSGEVISHYGSEEK